MYCRKQLSSWLHLYGIIITNIVNKDGNLCSQVGRWEASEPFNAALLTWMLLMRCLKWAIVPSSGQLKQMHRWKCIKTHGHSQHEYHSRFVVVFAWPLHVNTLAFVFRIFQKRWENSFSWSVCVMSKCETIQRVVVHVASMETRCSMQINV